MIGKLLMRGMLAGLVAGLLGFGFAHCYAEVQVDRAIAFETHEHELKGDAPDPEIVSRETQAGLGLLTGVVAFGTALGGLFALTFAYSWQRAGNIGAQPLAAMLALLAFLTLVIVPDLKYPPNPPSIGNPETIGYRTGLYFFTILCSIVITVLSFNVRRLASQRIGRWNGALVAIATFVVLVVVLLNVLPDIDEVPAGFPAALLWKFRVDSLVIQAIIWSTVGVLFGALARFIEPGQKPSARLTISRRSSSNAGHIVNRRTSL